MQKQKWGRQRAFEARGCSSVWSPQKSPTEREKRKTMFPRPNGKRVPKRRGSPKGDTPHCFQHHTHARQGPIPRTQPAARPAPPASSQQPRHQQSAPHAHQERKVIGKTNEENQSNVVPRAAVTGNGARALPNAERNTKRATAPSSTSDQLGRAVDGLGEWRNREGRRRAVIHQHATRPRGRTAHPRRSIAGHRGRRGPNPERRGLGVDRLPPL